MTQRIPSPPALPLHEVYAILQEAVDKVGFLHSRLDVSAATAFAIGQAFGALGVAKDMVAREGQVDE